MLGSAPTVDTAIADQSSLEDAAWTFAVLASSFADVDGDSLSFTAALASALNQALIP